MCNTKEEQDATHSIFQALVRKATTMSEQLRHDAEWFFRGDIDSAHKLWEDAQGHALFYESYNSRDLLAPDLLWGVDTVDLYALRALQTMNSEDAWAYLEHWMRQQTPCIYATVLYVIVLPGRSDAYKYIMLKRMQCIDSDKQTALLARIPSIWTIPFHGTGLVGKWNHETNEFSCVGKKRQTRTHKARIYVESYFGCTVQQNDNPEATEEFILARWDGETLFWPRHLPEMSQCTDTIYGYLLMQAKRVVLSGNETLIAPDTFRDNQTIREILTLPGRTVRGLNIGNNAFEKSMIERVEINGECHTIREKAFFHCLQLQNVYCTSIKYIEGCAFKYCSQLQSIHLNKTMVIRDQAFYHCTHLEQLGDVSALVHIGCEAFMRCDALRYIELSETIGYFGARAFKASGLRVAQLHKNANPIWKEEVFTQTLLMSFVVPDGVETLPPRTFMDCKELMALSWGPGMKWIRDAACKNAINLQQVIVLPETVNCEAFKNCGKAVFLPSPACKDLHRSALEGTTAQLTDV